MCGIKSDRSSEVGLHVFERAGLGKAPFRFKGMYVDVGPKKLENGMSIGAEGQPMGSCDYCGVGIKFCCVIRSADGREFVVGSSCVNKAGDKGLIRAYKGSREWREKLREDRRRLDAKKREELERLREKLKSEMAGRPHPYWEDSWGGEKKSFLDYFDWIMRNGGAKGRHNLLKRVREFGGKKDESGGLAVDR